MIQCSERQHCNRTLNHASVANESANALFPDALFMVDERWCRL
jgi:hypothetical protein